MEKGYLPEAIRKLDLYNYVEHDAATGLALKTLEDLMIFSDPSELLEPDLIVEKAKEKIENTGK